MLNLAGPHGDQAEAPTVSESQPSPPPKPKAVDMHLVSLVCHRQDRPI